MRSFRELRDEELARDPELRAEYERLKPVYHVVSQLIAARKEAGLSQAEIAAKLGTKQSSISRLEYAPKFPSFELLQRYNQVVGQTLTLVPQRDAARPRLAEEEP